MRGSFGLLTQFLCPQRQTEIRRGSMHVSFPKRTASYAARPAVVSRVHQSAFTSVMVISSNERRRHGMRTDDATGDAARDDAA